MNTAKFVPLEMLVVLLLCGCSIDISQSGATQSAAQGQPGGLPAASAAPLFNAAGSKGQGPGNMPQSGKIPVTWASLNLKGRLYYLSGVVKEMYLLVNVQSLDLSTGDVTTLFQTPIDGWIDSAAVSPDGQQLIIAYVPPQGPAFGGQEALYVMPTDGSKPPALLFTPASDKDRSYQPAWAPDGSSLYFTNVNYAASAPFQIARISYPEGKLAKVIDGAYWPSVSPDGTQLTYATVDPATGINRLFVARADGTGAHEVVLAATQATGIIDAPLILPGGQTILFSAPPAQGVDVLPANRGFAADWLDKIMGITVASAHASIPSDWWTVPIAGGVPTQVTHIHSYGLFASVSPDGRYVASFSSDGIFVMKPDGTGLTALVPSVGGIPGTVSWAP